MDAAPEAHAITTVSRGPPRRSREPSVSAWLTGRMERSARIRGEGRPVRVSSQYHSSPSSIPPPTAPTTRAACPRSPGVSTASARASCAAASARRSARARRPDTPSVAIASAGTSAAILERKPSVSTSVTGRIAHVPEDSPVQNVFAPAPYGLTTPRPVTRTLVIRRRSALPRLREDEPRKAVEGLELGREVLRLVDDQAESLLQGDGELDEVERVQAE